jgi:drug/metabolite transporter (DMT)-like permease
LYLTVAGSIIAYPAYIWLLHATTPARVATYAYVNPLIAVILGGTLGREVFSREIYFAGGLIIIAVMLVLRGGAAKPQPKPRAPTTATTLAPQDP